MGLVSLTELAQHLVNGHDADPHKFITGAGMRRFHWSLHLRAVEHGEKLDHTHDPEDVP